MGNSTEATASPEVKPMGQKEKANPRERKLREVFSGLSKDPRNGVEVEVLLALAETCDTGGKCVWTPEQHRRLVNSMPRTRRGDCVAEEQFVESFGATLPSAHIDFLDVIGNFVDGTPKALRKSKLGRGSSSPAKASPQSRGRQAEEKPASSRAAEIQESRLKNLEKPALPEKKAKVRGNLQEKPTLPAKKEREQSGKSRDSSAKFESRSVPPSTSMSPAKRGASPDKKSTMKKEETKDNSDYMDRQMAALGM